MSSVTYRKKSPKRGYYLNLNGSEQKILKGLGIEHFGPFHRRQALDIRDSIEREKDKKSQSLA